MQKHTVRFLRAGEECNTDEKNKTILKVADANGVEFKRGCSNGMCNLCRCEIREGIENIMHKRTKRPFTNEKAVLACVAEVCGDVSVVEAAKKSV